MCAITMALSTGLGPVLGVIMILIFMGLTYKMAGQAPAFAVGIASTFMVMYLGFMPIMWGVTIIFAMIAGTALVKYLQLG